MTAQAIKASNVTLAISIAVAIVNPTCVGCAGIRTWARGDEFGDAISVAQAQKQIARNWLAAYRAAKREKTR